MNPCFWEFIFEFIIRGDLEKVQDLFLNTQFYEKNHIVKKFV